MMAFRAQKATTSKATPRNGAAKASKAAKRAARNALMARICIFLAVVIVAIPFILRAQASYEEHAAVTASRNTVAGWPDKKTKQELDAARQYNEKLYASGQHTLGEANDPFQNSASDGSTATGSKADGEYQSLLDTGSGMMGSIDIPKISVNIPIYHGTDADTLERGAGHLYGTSLPVGGKNTHAVITGHRGLVGATLFTRLDELNTGDTFTIETLGRTLAYKVDGIVTILPTEGERYLRIRPGEDRVTLMTCTPYGVNTHRLLVSAHRIPLSELGQQQDPAAYVDMAIFAVLVALVALTMKLTRRKRWMRIQHATDRKGL